MLKPSVAEHSTQRWRSYNGGMANVFVRLLFAILPCRHVMGITMHAEHIRVPLEASNTSDQSDSVVFLREETVVLRWLFGYYDERRSHGLSIVPRWPWRIDSTWNKGEKKTSFRAATLVGIDVDELKEEDGMPVTFHMGVSIVHTQDLHNQCHLPLRHISSKPPVIRSVNLLIGDNIYSARNKSRFCFGRHRRLSLRNLGAHLKELIGTPCPLILVVHGGYRETNLLERLGINLQPMFTIDTIEAARYPMQVFYNFTLRGLLETFGIPFNSYHLHVAGNDAHFILRALLMIAVADARRELEKLPVWLPVFEAIARAALPAIPPLCDAGEAMRRAKQLQKARLKRHSIAAMDTGLVLRTDIS